MQFIQTFQNLIYNIALLIYSIISYRIVCSGKLSGQLRNSYDFVTDIHLYTLSNGNSVANINQ